MAGDWIPIRHDLVGDPAVIDIADLLDCDVNVVIGGLVRVWCWFDTHTVDGCHAPSVTGVTLAARVSRVAGVTGFGEAMQQVGWLHKNGLPNFERWIHGSAKQRLLAAKRQQKKRGRPDETRHARVTPMSRPQRDKSVTTEQNSTEQKEQTPAGSVKPKKPRAAFGEVKAQFEQLWKQYPTRRGRKVGKAEALRAFEKLDPDERKAAVDSITRWAAHAGDFPVDCVRFLKNARWLDEIDTTVAAKADADSASTQAEGQAWDLVQGWVRKVGRYGELPKQPVQVLRVVNRVGWSNLLDSTHAPTTRAKFREAFMADRAGGH